LVAGHRWWTMRHPTINDTRTAQNSPRRGGRKGHPEIPWFSGSLFD
jgi:hypothetical protein